jgi:hypothetical protein
MRTMLRRPILAFALGLALAVAAFAGTAAYGALTDQTVMACYAPKTGALSVVGRDGAPDECAAGTLPISWSERGPQGLQGRVGPAGPAGTFAGTFTGPYGAYSISVTNAGIVLSGSGSTVRLSGPSVSVDSAGTTTVRGAVVQLNGGAGCAPVTRVGDVVPVPEHAGFTTAATGSATVCAG